jgi:hypothetical protein
LVAISRAEFETCWIFNDILIFSHGKDGAFLNTEVHGGVPSGSRGFQYFYLSSADGDGIYFDVGLSDGDVNAAADGATEACC